MLRAALEPARDDVGIGVAEAARLLGCDQTTVRELVRTGRLEAWRIGKGRNPRGIRVSREAVFEYRDRHRVAPQPSDESGQLPARKPARRRQSAAHLEALRYLRSLGMRV
jgi:excisionase family DNA binding protein